MNQRIEKLLAAGESRTVEFKAARRLLNRNLYETVCAFLNRNGGDILLGVTDRGKVQGIDKDCLVQMKKDFANTVNNRQKLVPPCYLNIEEVEHDGVTLLHIVVPPSSQVHRCNGRIYDRNEDGDYDITDNQALVAQRYLSKQSYYSENRIYPYATLADLNPELIARARELAGIRQPGHPWLPMSDEELLDSAQLRQRDYAQDVQGLTLAAILLFGKDSTILSVLPHHRTDAILRRVNVDRYDDRDDIRTNLLDSHGRLLTFGEKHLNDPFYLDGNQQVSLRGRILREIIGNLLTHREYSHAFPAKLVIEADRLFTENSNKPNDLGLINPKSFSPFPKNPTIARVFREIGWADELGSGVRKLYRYCRLYCGQDPELMEDDIFRFSLSLVGAMQETPVETGETTVETGETTVETGETTVETEETPVETGETPVETGETPVETGETTVETGETPVETTPEQIIRILSEDPEMSLVQVAEAIGKSIRAVEKASTRLVKEGRLQRIGPKKGGHWKISK